MALDAFIPEVWSARLLTHLDKAHVFGKLVSREYEGEVKNLGDTVRITQIGNITVKDYTKNTPIDAPEELTGTQITLTVDQAKYFNFAVDDVEAAQANVKVMDAAMKRAAYELADTTDAFLAGLVSNAGVVVDDGAGGALVVDNVNTKAYDLLVDIVVELESKNVPKANRWIVLPPWFIGMLLKDDRLTKVDYQRMLETGEIPGIVGVKVYVSNNVYYDSVNKVWHAMAGIPEAIAYVEQITKIEAYRPQDKFADAVKGLLVYGGKVLLPDAVAKIMIAKA